MGTFYLKLLRMRHLVYVCRKLLYNAVLVRLELFYSMQFFCNTCIIIIYISEKMFTLFLLSFWVLIYFV